MKHLSLLSIQQPRKAQSVVVTPKDVLIGLWLGVPAQFIALFRKEEPTDE